MPTTHTTLWRAVEDILGEPVAADVRRFCRLQGWVNDYLGEDDPEEGEEVVSSMAEIVRNLQDSGLVPRTTDSLAPSLQLDRRWVLLRNLNAAYHEGEPNAPGGDQGWQPLRLSRIALNLDAYPATSEVVLRFDHRLSLRALIGALRGIWPQVRARGWLRRTRPLGDRALTLVRSVCLETPPRSTWRDRLDKWNAAYPDLAYADVRALERDFRRAERQLTGERYGLEWFYEPLARLDLTDLYRAKAAGERRAGSLIRRRLAEMKQSRQRLLEALAQRHRKKGS